MAISYLVATARNPFMRSVTWGNLQKRLKHTSNIMYIERGLTRRQRKVNVLLYSRLVFA